MQLYYMCKDQHKASDASVILMTVAVMYKFVLVVIGGILAAVLETAASEVSGRLFFCYISWECF